MKSLEIENPANRSDFKKLAIFDSSSRFRELEDTLFEYTSLHTPRKCKHEEASEWPGDRIPPCIGKFREIYAEKFKFYKI